MGKSTISTVPWLQVRKLFDITRPGQNHHLSLFQAPSRCDQGLHLDVHRKPHLRLLSHVGHLQAEWGQRHGKVYGDGNHLHKYSIFYS